MSWNAHLEINGGPDDGGAVLADADWNYTSNTNAMITAALDASGRWSGGEWSWWQWLNGQQAAAGKVMLDIAVEQLERDPDRFRAMNPGNGWGNYDDLLDLLRTMARVAGEAPTATWRVSG